MDCNKDNEILKHEDTALYAPTNLKYFRGYARVFEFKNGEWLKMGPTIQTNTSNTYISNIYRFVGVTGIIIIYRSSSSSTGSIKTVRSAICVYVYSIAFDLAWCVYIISS